jgi:hypothetical protein
MEAACRPAHEGGTVTTCQRYVCLAGLAAAVSSCGSSPASPTSTDPRSPPSSVPATRFSVQILSGSTHQPVPGAHVVVGRQEYTTDQNGSVTPIGSSADIDIQAPGYLPRVSRVGQTGQNVTLWPVADDAEAEAVHRMVFGRRNAADVLYPFYPGGFYVTIPSASDEVRRAWQAAAADFGSVFQLNYVMESQFQYDTNEIEILFGADQKCTPSPTLGFCKIPSAYMVFAVPDDRATDPTTIRRVLASLFLGPNPFPGLLNPDAPGDTLSPFEMQTIRMILQRPGLTRWPDDDRP